MSRLSKTLSLLFISMGVAVAVPGLVSVAGKEATVGEVRHVAMMTFFGFIFVGIGVLRLCFSAPSASPPVASSPKFDVIEGGKSGEPRRKRSG